MKHKYINRLLKLFVVMTLVLMTVACGGNSSNAREDKYRELWHNGANSFDVIANIQPESVVMHDDGSLTFNSVTDEGIVIPFYAVGTTYENGSLVMSNTARLVSLKAVGQILGYSPLLSDPGHTDNCVDGFGYYTFSEETEVESVAQLTHSTGRGGLTLDFTQPGCVMELFDFLPNFIGLHSSINNVDAFTLSEFLVYYTTDTYTTDIKYLTVWEEYFVPQMVGAGYDASYEGRFDEDNGILDFYLIAVPDVYGDEEVDYVSMALENNTRSIWGIKGSVMTVGDLKDSSGNVVNKVTAAVEKGMTLDIHFGKHTYTLTLPVIDAFKGAKNIHELVPNAYPSAIGDLNVLVVPMNWNNEEATDAKLQTMKQMIGQVSENGAVKDYTGNEESLSSYFNKASYGNLNIKGYFTEWYQAPYSFEEMKYQPMSQEFVNEIISWVYDTQKLDMNAFDQNGNNLFDAVIFLNSGNMSMDEGYAIESFSGAYHRLDSYTGAEMANKKQYGVNSYITMHTQLGANTLIHEFGHQLGLVDYYDVTYSGYNAVGNYDMQSGNSGDWNPYSKYAVGWTTPIVVKDLASGESVDIEIGSFTTTGDTILIPAVNTEFDGPFNEYIMVDLLTDEALAMYQANDWSGLQKGEYGVRMYHVNALMERRDLEVNGTTYPIGTIHYSNVHNDDGKYLIEMIQAGGENTFTNANREVTQFSASDLFQVNDEFSLDSHQEFFNAGLMDSGKEFGYSIKVVSIDKVNGEYKAVIRVTRD